MTQHGGARDFEGPERLQAENDELRIRLSELEETLQAIHRGDVDALVINNAVFTLESAHSAADRLRQDVLDQMEDAVFAFDMQGRVMFTNKAAERRYGIAASDALGKAATELYREQALVVVEALAQRVEQGSKLATHWLSDGSHIEVEVTTSPLLDGLETPFGTLSVIRDVTQHLRTQSRRAALAQLTEALQDVDDPAGIAAVAARLLGEALAVRHAGYGTVDASTGDLQLLADWSAADGVLGGGTWRLASAPGMLAALEKGETVAVAEVAGPTRYGPGVVGYRAARSFIYAPVVEQGRLVAVFSVHDEVARAWSGDDLDFVREFAARTRSVAERARATRALVRSETELRAANEALETAVAARTRELTAAEDALRQSQKMEAIGQLTGGLAHDFNNLLGGVSASLQVLQEKITSGSREDVDRYIRIGQDGLARAAAVTQRLLAFARRQTLDPTPVDLNQLVVGLQDLVQRTVGPNVQVDVLLTDAPCVTRVDVSQLENSLINLCINARDAMQPMGGRLLVETRAHHFSESPGLPGALPAGEYVSLAVSDTGTGMSAEVTEHMFDPFFTTKPLGQGTGLGLSMVYGFVRQSGGEVNVTSELGSGTTVCMYLPRHAGSVPLDIPRPSSGQADIAHGGTVLFIEDEPSIREITTEVLTDAGLRVLSAEDGPGGLRILDTGEPIDLLLTDVGLPGGLNGRQVAEVARLSRPELKVLFITGYAGGAGVGDGTLAEGMEVVTKPFDVFALAERIQKMVRG